MADPTEPSPKDVAQAVDRLLMASTWDELKSAIVEEPLLLMQAAFVNLVHRANAATQQGAADSRIRMLTIGVGLHLCAEDGVEPGLERWVQQGWRDTAELTKWFMPAIQGDPEVDLQGELDLAREMMSLARYDGGPFSGLWDPGIDETVALLSCWRDRGGGMKAAAEIYRWRRRHLARTDLAAAEWPSRAADLAGSAQSLFMFTGDSALLEESIDLYKQSFARHDDPCARTDLARSLLLRYERSGEEADLATALSLAEKAAAEVTDPAKRAWALDVSGMALADGFTRLGDARLLELAIDRQTAATTLAPLDSELRPAHIGNLAASLAQRYTLKMDKRDLQRSIELLREEVTLCPPGRELRPDALANLGAMLLVPDSPDAAAVAEAAEHLREAINTAGARPTVPLWRANLGRALAHLGDPAKAAEEFTAALADMDEGNADRAALLGLLADAEAAQGIDPLPHYRAAIESGRASYASAALRAAQDGASWAAAHDDEGAARKLYNEGLKILDGLASKQRAITDELAWRRNAARTVDDGAVFLALHGHVDDAIEHLERGRAAILRRILRRDHEATADLSAVAAVQPLALLVAGSTSGVAIYLSADGRSSVNLPGLTRDQLWNRTIGLLTAQEQRRALGGAARWQQILDATAQWLYQTVFQPLIADVGPLGPRLALGVDGLLGSLPFAAAWWTDAKAPGGRRFVVDATALTIVPSGISLQAALERSTITPNKSLVIVAPAQTGLPDLEWAHAEALDAAALLPGCGVLTDTGATLKNVLTALADVDILHVATHGKADLLRPLDSGIVLSDGQMLTVSHLLGAAGRARRLAVLSACETSVSGAVAPTEAVGLPTAFLSLGFAGVIGTLWPVSDSAARLLIPETLRRWLSGDCVLAEALAAAQRWLRRLPAAEAEALLGQPVASEHPFASIRSWGAFAVTGA